jgi:hypothetical protein
MKLRPFCKLIFILAVMLAYQELTIRWAPAPPEPPVDPPSTPIGNSITHLATIAGVFGYGVWRFFKK